MCCGHGTRLFTSVMFKGPRMECGHNAGVNSGTAMAPRMGSLAGLLVLAVCLWPLRPSAFVGATHQPQLGFLVALIAQLQEEGC